MSRTDHERAAPSQVGRPQGPVGVGPARRALDVTVAVVSGVLLMPLLLAAAAWVMLDSGRPVVFRQERVGEGGKLFVLYKLRTMRCSGPRGPEVTAGSDVRVTRSGRVLRASSIDELPQLLNVIRGQMTLVGPRPETPDLACRYPPECRWVLHHRPGLTGPAQIALRDNRAIPDDVQDVEGHYLSVLVPRRVALDATFLARPTLRATLGVVWRTVVHLVRPSATAS